MKSRKPSAKQPNPTATPNSTGCCDGQIASGPLSHQAAEIPASNPNSTAYTAAFPMVMSIFTSAFPFISDTGYANG